MYLLYSLRAGVIGMMQKEIRTDLAAAGIRQFLEALGLDLKAQGMEETPERVAAFGSFFAGLRKDGVAVLGEPIHTQSSGLIAVRRLPFYSICEHHLLPFFGTVSIVYLPCDGKFAGFGHFAEAVRVFAQRPQLQERLTGQICAAVAESLTPAGVLVLVKARHLCLAMCSEKTGLADIVTVSACGALKEGETLYESALRLLEEE